MTTNQDIIDFSALCILIGDNFHNDLEWARDILTNPANESVRPAILKQAAIKHLKLDNESHGQ